VTATVSIEGPTMSTSIATKAVYTPEDLLTMPDGNSYELIDGQVVERQMGAESTWVGTRLVPDQGKKAGKRAWFRPG
jgi:hypothetical protein